MVVLSLRGGGQVNPGVWCPAVPKRAADRPLTQSIEFFGLFALWTDPSNNGGWLQQAACSCTVDPRALLKPRVLLIDGNFTVARPQIRHAPERADVVIHQRKATLAPNHSPERHSEHAWNRKGTPSRARSLKGST
jgi:hypothetical protein